MKICQRILITLLIALQGFAARAAIHYVNVNSVNPVSPYSSMATAATNIQSAVNVAASFDVIMVASGVYSAGSGMTQDGTTNRVATTVPLTIQSISGTNSTIIDGGGSMRCIYLVNGCTLNGFTLSNGLANLGGGIYCVAASFINSCLVISNSATGGAGGVFGGTLTGCTIKGNSAQYTNVGGGGVINATLNNCTLASNIVGVAHAISTGPSAGGGAFGCTLNNCALYGNIAYGVNGVGGGTFSSTLNSCVLFNNTAEYGGGGAYDGSAINCVIYGNSATVGGGAANGTLNNCTVCNNQGTNGGGTYGVLAANNSIIYSNTLPNDAGSSLNYCCIPGTFTNGCITNAPLFQASVSNNNSRLQQFSPCVNGGNNVYQQTSTDLDNSNRVVGGTIDIGAYEYQAATTNSGLPSVPTNFTGTFAGGEIQFQWDASAKAASHNLFIVSPTDGTSKIAAFGLGGTKYSYDAFTLGGTTTYYLTASNAYGQSAPSVLVMITAVDHFALNAIANPQIAGVSFSLNITASDGAGNKITNFTNSCLLAATGDHGNVALTPSITPAFTNGQWTGLITLDSLSPDSNIRLAAFTNNVIGSSRLFNSIASPIQTFNLTAADLVYSPLKQRLYATIPATAPVSANSLLTIDPTIGRTENTVHLGNDPSHLAVSADGQYLYIGFNGTNSLSRFNLASNAVDLSFLLTNKSGSPYEASAVAALPGLPHSIVVAGASTTIFDDGIQRSNYYAVGNLVVAESATQLLAMGGGFPPGPFTLLNVDATGITTNFTHEDGIVGTNETFKYQNGLVFTSTGTIFNPANSNILGQLTNCVAVEPDLPASLIFALGSQPDLTNAWSLYAWNATNYQVITNIPISGVSSTPTTLVRWGANGLAFTAGSQLYLVRTTAMIPTVTPAITAASIQPATTNFQFSFIGDPSTPYSISASTNLTTWTNLGPPNLISNTLFQFSDSNATNFSTRFYRVSTP